RDSSARTSVPTRRSASRTRTGLPMATSPSRISTRGNALALISPIVTGCPMAFASCAASAERTASPVKTALAQRNPPPTTMSAAMSAVTAILFFIFLSRGAPPPRADALGALFNARGAPPPLGHPSAPTTRAGDPARLARAFALARAAGAALAHIQNRTSQTAETSPLAVAQGPYQPDEAASESERRTSAWRMRRPRRAAAAEAVVCLTESVGRFQMLQPAKCGATFPFRRRGRREGRLPPPGFPRGTRNRKSCTRDRDAAESTPSTAA